MCQSKEEGGIRCFSHAREALASNEDKYVEMVIAKSEEVNGTKLAPAETHFGGFEDGLKLNVMLGGDSSLQKLNTRREELADEIRASHRIVEESVKNNDMTSLVKMMKATDPELKSLRTQRSELLEKVKQDVANAKTNEEALALYAVEERESRKIIAEIKTRSHVIEEEATDIINLRNVLNDEPVFKHIRYRTPDGIRALRKEYLSVSDKAREETAKKTELYKKRIGGYNLKQTAEFKKVATSQELRKSSEYKSWREKNASVKADYAITSTMMSDLKVRITEEPEGSQSRAKLETQYATLLRVREAKIANNKKEAAAAKV